MKKPLAVSLFAASLFSVQAHSTMNANEINRSVNDSIVEAGDMVQLLLPATGYFATWMHDDLEGEQLTYSALSTQLIIHGVKNAVGRRRPNDSSWNFCLLKPDVVVLLHKRLPKKMLLTIKVKKY